MFISCLKKTMENLWEIDDFSESTCRGWHRHSWSSLVCTDCAQEACRYKNKTITLEKNVITWWCILAILDTWKKSAKTYIHNICKLKIFRTDYIVLVLSLWFTLLYWICIKIKIWPTFDKRRIKHYSSSRSEYSKSDKLINK